MKTLRIAMWSGPRNISTAMMRSWESRADTQVVDEPFYAFYLSQTKKTHPCAEEVLASMNRDYDQVVRQLTEQPCDLPIYYQKHMTHHMLDQVDLSWVKQVKHCFLIRKPANVVASYSKSRGVCSVEDIGVIRQAQLYHSISEISGQDIPILDADDISKNPRMILTKLCDQFAIPFLESMLHWDAGKRDSDGVWSQHWYKAVEQSTGFLPYKPKHNVLSPEQEKIVEQVQPYYEKLYKQRIKP